MVTIQNKIIISFAGASIRSISHFLNYSTVKKYFLSAALGQHKLYKC